jgi:hypothetical protein
MKKMLKGISQAQLVKLDKSGMAKDNTPRSPSAHLDYQGETERNVSGLSAALLHD